MVYPIFLPPGLSHSSLQLTSSNFLRFPVTKVSNGLETGLFEALITVLTDRAHALRIMEHVELERGRGGGVHACCIITSRYVTTKMSSSTSSGVEERLARKLASNDLPTRNKALKRLKKWIAARSTVENGQFFCTLRRGEWGLARG